MNLGELVLMEVVAAMAAILIPVLIWAIYKLVKIVGGYLGFCMAELEAYHIARRVLKIRKNNDEVYEGVLMILSSRLKSWGIKLSSEELDNIVLNTLEDLADEDTA